VLGAEEGEEIADASLVDGVAVRILIVCLNGFGEFRFGWELPVGAFVEGRNEDAFVLGLEPCVGFEESLLEDVLGGGVGVEGLALLDADGFEVIDHDLVAGEPGLDLNYAVERLEEAEVVGDGGVEDYVDGVDELGVRGMSGLRERVDFDPFCIGDC
jgi:hypothetical protein